MLTEAPARHLAWTVANAAPDKARVENDYTGTGHYVALDIVNWSATPYDIGAATGGFRVIGTTTPGGFITLPSNTVTII